VIHSMFTSAGAVASGSVVSSTVIVCTSVVTFPQSSSISYVLVIISGQVFPSETSDTCVTAGATVQLSASSVIARTSTTGISAVHSTVTSAGAVPVGAILSLTVITCVTWNVFPHSSSIS